MHYKTIKFNIKIPLKHTKCSFFRRALREKVKYRDFAREARRKIWHFSNFCPPPPPPHPKNGSTPLLFPPDEVCQVRHWAGISLQSDVALCDAVVFTILRHLSLSSAALTASCSVIPVELLMSLSHDVGGRPLFFFRWSTGHQVGVSSCFVVHMYSVLQCCGALKTNYVQVKTWWHFNGA